MIIMFSISLGPSRLFFNDEYIGNTIKSEGTTLKIQSVTQEIKTDESPELKEILELGKNITFEGTILIDENSIFSLDIDSSLENLVKKGELKLMTMDNLTEIRIFNAVITLDVNLNFKQEGLHTIKLKAKALRNKNNKIIEITSI